MRKLGTAIFASCALCWPFAAQATDPLPRAKPEAVGMSSERLALIRPRIDAEIARDQLPGGVLAIVRRGRLVHFEPYGFLDKAAGVPMRTDAIFNIASMTKPMAAVAALQLYEQGRLTMNDPVSKYFPQFAKQQVAVLDAKKENIVDRVAPVRPITVQDLFRHTSGLVYGGRGATPVHKLFPSGSTPASESMTGPEFIEGLASAPLLYQPGAVWDYGFGLDVLGLIVEQLSEQSLGRYLQENVWKPLGMTDTHFVVPQDKLARYAKALPIDPDTGKPQSLRSFTRADEVRMRRRLHGLDRRRLSALRAHAVEQGHPCRPARARPQDGRVHDRQSSRSQCREHDRCDRRSVARRLRLRARRCGPHAAGDFTHHDVGRHLCLAGRQRHQLVGRSARRAHGRVDGALARHHPLALAAGDQRAGLSGVGGLNGRCNCGENPHNLCW